MSCTSGCMRQAVGTALVMLCVWPAGLLPTTAVDSNPVTVKDEAAQDPALSSNFNIGVPGEDTQLESNFTQPFDPNIRQGVSSSANLWPKINGFPTIIYKMGGTRVQSSTIRAALDQYELHTCLRFQQTPKFLSLGYRLSFVAGSGCSSYVGYQPNFINWIFGQHITLAEACDKVWTVIHEVGHALGLYHTQGRSDRDSHVKILFQNVQAGMQNNFNKYNTKDFDTEYDLLSVMHYGPFAFTSNGKPTIIPMDPLAKGLMLVPRFGLTHMDKLLVNRLYGCVDLWVSKCAGISGDRCQNLGYVGPNCTCVCPAGTSGELCETKIVSYTKALMNQYLPKNQVLITEEAISSATTMMGDIFTKLFEAPACFRPQLTVTYFQLAARDLLGRCSVQGTEIGLDGPSESGTVYCGSELEQGQNFTSNFRTLFVFYWVGINNGTLGFEFDVKFVQKSGCTEVEGSEVITE